MICHNVIDDSDYPLFVDTSFASPGATLKDVVYGILS